MIVNCVALVVALLMAGAAIQRFLGLGRSGSDLAVTVIWLLAGLYMLMIVIGQASTISAVTHAI